MLSFTSYNKKVFRNFATLIHSEELVDDLTLSKTHQNILKKFFYPDNSPSSRLERVMNRSVRQIILNEINSKFNPQNWYFSRFSDGSWPVLYAAESENTALKEILYHLKLFYQEELRKKDIWVDRRVVRLKIKSNRCLDLRKQKLNDKKLTFYKLTSQTTSGYPYCQQLSQKWISKGGELFCTPSARDPGGICVPIFNKKIIQKDEGHLKYLKCLLKKDGDVMVLKN